MEEGVKLEKKKRDDGDDDIDGGYAHPCLSLFHCSIFKAFLGCLGFLHPHDEPLLPTQSSNAATQDENYGVITTTVHTLLSPLLTVLE